MEQKKRFYKPKEKNVISLNKFYEIVKNKEQDERLGKSTHK